MRIKKTLVVEGINPQTIHQHLIRNRWMDPNFNILEGGNKTFSKVIIIDESSMMAVDIFATLIKSIEFDNVKRFILVGDPNQLPPIGPGRPFDDIIKWLKTNEKYKQHIGDLKEIVRQKNNNSDCLRLADGFLRDFKSKNIEEIYTVMEQNKLSKDSDLFFAEWKDHDELIDKLDSILNDIGISDHDSYRDSVGLTEKDFNKCESWQILSPVKQKEVVGTVSLNNFLQNKFLAKTLNEWRFGKKPKSPKPFGKTKDNCI